VYIDDVFVQLPIARRFVTVGEIDHLLHVIGILDGLGEINDSWNVVIVPLTGGAVRPRHDD
jgi:hypothetical protein